MVARPGGLLEELADTHALKAAAVLVTVVGAVLEAARSSEAELAAFVPALHAALEECVGIMAADQSADGVRSARRLVTKRCAVSASTSLPSLAHRVSAIRN